jgi:hypothetical protein
MDQSKLKELQDEYQLALAKLDMGNIADTVFCYGSLLIKYGNEITKIGEELILDATSIEGMITHMDNLERAKMGIEFATDAAMPLKIPASTIDENNLNLNDIEAYQYLLRYQKMMSKLIQVLTNKISCEPIVPNIQDYVKSEE